MYMRYEWNTLEAVHKVISNKIYWIFICHFWDYSTEHCFPSLNHYLVWATMYYNSSPKSNLFYIPWNFDFCVRLQIHCNKSTMKNIPLIQVHKLNHHKLWLWYLNNLTQITNYLQLSIHNIYLYKYNAVKI